MKRSDDGFLEIFSHSITFRGQCLIPSQFGSGITSDTSHVACLFLQLHLHRPGFPAAMVQAEDDQTLRGLQRAG
jgi:hypothetical protein